MIDSITTVTRLFLDACRAHPKPDLFLVKRAGAYRPVSTAEFAAGVRDLALGFRDLGLAPGGKAVLLSENRPEHTTSSASESSMMWRICSGRSDV